MVTELETRKQKFWKYVIWLIPMTYGVVVYVFDILRYFYGSEFDTFDTLCLWLGNSFILLICVFAVTIEILKSRREGFVEWWVQEVPVDELDHLLDGSMISELPVGGGIRRVRTTDTYGQGQLI